MYNMDNSIDCNKKSEMLYYFTFVSLVRKIIINIVYNIN